MHPASLHHLTVGKTLVRRETPGQNWTARSALTLRPRTGDTNFKTPVAGQRIDPEALGGAEPAGGMRPEPQLRNRGFMTRQKPGPRLGVQDKGHLPD